MSQQTVSDLKAARALVAAGWTRGAYARDGRGRRVPLNSPLASRFCLLGATFRVVRGGTVAEAERRGWAVMRALSSTSGHKSLDLIGFNDRRGRSESDILALFDRAIAAEEQAP